MNLTDVPCAGCGKIIRVGNVDPVAAYLCWPSCQEKSREDKPALDHLPREFDCVHCDSLVNAVPVRTQDGLSCLECAERIMSVEVSSFNSALKDLYKSKIRPAAHLEDELAKVTQDRDALLDSRVENAALLVENRRLKDLISRIRPSAIAEAKRQRRG